MNQGQRAGIELAERLELRAGALPVPQNAEELEQEHAQLRVRRLRTHAHLKRGECSLRLPRPQELLGPYSWFFAKSHVALTAPPGAPSSDCGVYSTSTAVNEKATLSWAGDPSPDPLACTEETIVFFIVIFKYSTGSVPRLRQVRIT